jgi:hypothetical protein
MVGPATGTDCLGTMRVFLIVLTLLSPVSALAQRLLGPYQPDEYGPGINSDAAGRPFSWQLLHGDGAVDPVVHFRPNPYGPGIGLDQYGRPVQPVLLSYGTPEVIDAENEK